MKDRRLVRRATLNGYEAAATAAGLDPANMLREVGLPTGASGNPDELISFDGFLKLLALSAERSGLMDFGVRAAHARGIPDLGAISLLMREADNVEAAIRLYTSHIRLHSDGTFIYLQSDFEYPVISVDMSGGSILESMQVVQFGIAGILMQLRWLIGEEYRPELITFGFPPFPDHQFARKIFQCEVLHNQNLSGLVLNPTILARPLVTSQPFLRRLAIQQLQPLLQRGRDTMAMRVTRMISERLENGDFSSQAIAEALGIDRRTLNRRLEREGTNYQTLLQKLRLQIVQQAMHNSGQSITDISCSIGFQSLSAFSRWCQSAFGCSATKMRATQNFVAEDGYRK